MTTLQVVRGTKATFDISVVHPITGEPIDIDDPTTDIEMLGALAYDDVDEVFRVTRDGGDIVPTPGAPGRATVELPPAATTALPNETTRVFWDALVTIDAGEPFSVDRGMLLVLPKVPFSP